MPSKQTDYIRKLSEKLQQNAVPENVAPMKAYMKNRFEFFGLKAPQRRALFREFFAAEPLPPANELERNVLALFDLPEREFHYFAIELTGKFKRGWKPETLELFEKMILRRSWWDSVDYIKSVCLKDYFLRFPENRHQITQRWIDSGNIWLQRLSVIFQLGYRDKTDLELLKRNILQLIDSREFFVQKAIGWALRDYARTDPVFVRRFVSEHDLKPLSRREALKHSGR
ncbi:MAG: DNA alkylation repair protein [Pyrinomonadaceae bacterium]